MVERDGDAVFSGAIPERYEQYLVPLIFQPYAADLSARLRASSVRSVLEVAAGTGVVTRAISELLPASVVITATDLNQAMLDHAVKLGTARPVEWRQADVMSLPFDEKSFDAVVCQFGVMFFPDRVRAFSEVRRVLRPGGLFLFNVWDRVESNEFPHVVCQALTEIFSDDPPMFLERTPYGYHDTRAIEADLRNAGFEPGAQIEPVEQRARAVSADVVAMAFCQGTPLRAEIEFRSPGRLAEVTTRVSAALARRFGSGEVEGRIRAYVVTARHGLQAGESTAGG